MPWNRQRHFLSADLRIRHAIMRFANSKIQKPQIYHTRTDTHTLPTYNPTCYMEIYEAICFNRPEHMYKMNIKWIPNTFFMSSSTVSFAAVSSGALDLLLSKLNPNQCIHHSVLFPFGLFCVTRTFSSFLTLHNILPSHRRWFRVCVCAVNHFYVCLPVPEEGYHFAQIYSVMYDLRCDSGIFKYHYLYECQTLTRNTFNRIQYR